MDILLHDNIAHYLYPDGAPEFHPEVVVIKDYEGEVKEGWVWNGTSFEPDIMKLNMDQVRVIRNILLAETDWWVLPDRTPSQAQLDYRQALRDITDTYTSPDDVVWPVKPEG